MSEQWQGLHNPNQHKRYKDECRLRMGRQPMNEVTYPHCKHCCTFAATITTGAVVWCIDRLWRGPKP